MSGGGDAVASLKRRLGDLLAATPGAQGRALVEEALAFAEAAHHGQTRDDGSPYLQHPLRAALILAEELGLPDPQLLAAALLHDVLEDVPQVTPQDLEQRFGPEITHIVRAVTKAPRRGRARDEHTADYHAAIGESGDAARIVKLADKLDNVRDAVTTPHRDKRARTAKDSRHLLDLLLPLLDDRHLAERLRHLFERALLGLKHASEL